MELRHLKYFIAVAEELNFRKAAKRLYIEQPTLSRQIRQLEEELHVDLFFRNKREVLLTEAGQAFLGEARLTMAQAERAARVVTQFNGDQQKKLTIGYVTCAFDRLLSKIIYAFRETYPEVEIVLKGMNSTPQAEALLAGEIDLGFAYLPINHPEISTKLVSRRPLMVALPQDHSLASLETIPMSLLADQPLIIYPRFVKPDFYDLIITLCHQAGFQPKIVQEATPPYLILSLVAAGLGIAVMGVSDEAEHNTGLVYRAIAESDSYLDLGIIWHQGKSSAIVNEFINVVKQYIESS